MLFFKLLNFGFEVLIFLSFLIKLIVELQGLVPKDNHLLLEILDAVIGGEHLFLLLGFMLDLSELFLYFGDMVSIGIQKLCFVLFDDMFHLFVHLIDGFVEVTIGL